MYEPHETLKCCVHCGGGRRHGIHGKPWDVNRMATILGAKFRDNNQAYQEFREQTKED